ncbi:hypothetical protein F0562_007656 [Nyssa sinensis]|uniref:GAT domain-containing protein n=1 Tax=Nyssa sinensis TaxID=561372 RepID=A0A5J5A914_9ASTE|nr:hypothetical protein F0562_007656 [Nyssa sinensis]
MVEGGHSECGGCSLESWYGKDKINDFQPPTILKVITSELYWQDDLTTTVVEQCHQSQFTMQRIIETAGDNEALLFEALNVNDEIQKVLLKYENLNMIVDVMHLASSIMLPIIGIKTQ